MQKVSTFLGIIIIIIAVAVIFGGVFAYQYFMPKGFGTISPAKILQNPAQTAGWKIYKSDNYGFEINYPQNFKVTVSPTYGGLLDLTFGYSSTPYIGDLSISVDANSKNETIVQYFERKKLMICQLLLAIAQLARIQILTPR